MTSVIVPPVDLAPGMPSRVVTISATDVTEGGKSLAGQMVRFALSDSLDVTSSGDVIAKSQAEVVLDANGEGSIRLPVYDEDVKTWCGQDWAILVTATWGSQKAIRVPDGTSSIALSALPPVRPLRGREKQWAITGVSVSTTEGAQWGATVRLNGGILDFDFTVPPGGTAFWKGPFASGVDLDTVTEPGTYGINVASQSANLPEQQVGTLTVSGSDAYLMQHYQTWRSGGMQSYVRRRSSDGWHAWEPIRWAQPAIGGATDLNTITMPGSYSVTSSAIVNGPPGETVFSLDVTPIGAFVIQRATTRDGITYARAQTGASQWREWVNPASPVNAATLGTTNLDTVLTQGRYNQNVTSNATPDNGYPFQVRGFLDVLVASPSSAMQVYYGTYTGRFAFREYYSGTWGQWFEPAADGIAALTTRVDALDDLVETGGSFDISIHAHQVREADLRRRVGRVSTGGKAAVALVFDHGVAAFRDKVLPLLRARNLPATLAVNGGMYEPDYQYASTNGSVTWADMRSWHDNDRIELANHSMTHHAQSGLAAIRAEIRDSRIAIEAGLGVPVDSWVQPGPLPGDPDNDGFGMGASSAAYYEYAMGRILLDEHAVVTGGVSTPQPTYPIDGTPPVGMWGRWIDAGTTQALADLDALVDRAVSRKDRCLIRSHPAYLDTSDSSSVPYATTAQLEALLDDLVARRDAGDIVVLPLREWAIATL